MKIQLILFVLAGIVLVACEKNREPQVTSFQLEITDYLTGDSMPYMGFSVTGVYAMDYNFSEVTNAYGRFDTIFLHEKQTDFNCVLDNTSNHFVAKSTGQIKNGVNTEYKMEIIPLALFSYNFNCSGSGAIKNVKREMVFPFAPEPAVIEHMAGEPNLTSYVSCGSSAYNVSVFSGTWAISYEKQDIASTSAWYTVYDTIYIAPDQNYVYTIIY